MPQQGVLSQEESTTTANNCTFAAFGSVKVYVHGILRGPWRLDRDNPHSFKRIIDVLPHGVEEVLMPKPTRCNARVLEKDTMNTTRNISGVNIVGEVHADGCIVPKKAAFAILSADCPTLVVRTRDGSVVVAAHAGRDSVIDRNYINADHKNLRVPFGVVQSAIDAVLKHAKCGVKDLFIGIYGGIQSNFLHMPNHPTYGNYNRSLIDFCTSIDGAVRDKETGDINMYAIIKGLAKRRGVPENQIFLDKIDTGQEGQTQWASHRHGHPKDRNLVIVHNDQ